MTFSDDENHIILVAFTEEIYNQASKVLEDTFHVAKIPVPDNFSRNHFKGDAWKSLITTISDDNVVLQKEQVCKRNLKFIKQRIIK